jgi:hypothetical protein
VQAKINKDRARRLKVLLDVYNAGNTGVRVSLCLLASLAEHIRLYLSSGYTR